MNPKPKLFVSSYLIACDMHSDIEECHFLVDHVTGKSSALELCYSCDKDHWHLVASWMRRGHSPVDIMPSVLCREIALFLEYN